MGCNTAWITDVIITTASILYTQLIYVVFVMPLTPFFHSLLIVKEKLFTERNDCIAFNRVKVLSNDEYFVAAYF